MSDSELSITRHLAAPRAAVWAAWEDPRVLEEWFCPKPWRAEVTAFDLRPGGAFRTVMHGPEGERVDEGDGCFVEVVPEERIVFTSVLGEDFRSVTPSGEGCHMPMTAIITMADDGEGTTYVARVLHANATDRQKHVDMGFEPGWNAVIDQLEAVAQRMARKHG